jgi:hypothetical protein
MRSVTTQSISRRVGSSIAAMVVLALVLLALHPILFAQSAGEHWVGTWSTSEVGRPQTPPAMVAGLPPFMANQCPPGPPPATTFMHFTNQTLRQVVHTSIGGSRVRVVLSNTYGTAPLTVGAAHIALRDKESSIQQASCDHLYPNDAGYKAMAEAIDLTLFKPDQTTPRTSTSSNR